MDRFVNIIDGWPSPPQPTIVGMQYQDFVKTASFLGYQATKQPRTTTPNTSRKMPTNSLESVAAHPYGLLFTFLPQVFTFQHNIHQDEFDFSD
jgi:hypothetical protein